MQGVIVQPRAKLSPVISPAMNRQKILLTYGM